MAIIKKFLFVYMIQCCDNSYYVGVTNALIDRYKDHEEGISRKAYTFSRRPFKLLYWETYDSAEIAICREKQLKGWTRAKKRALVWGELEELKLLARRKGI